MNQRIGQLVWAICAVCAVGSGFPLLAQGPGHGHGPGPGGPRDSEGPRWSERRERWQALDRGRRHDLRERFEELHRMAPENRDARLEKARRFRQIMEEVYVQMDPETKAKIDALEPEIRLRTLAKLALEVARERSREAELFVGEGAGSGDPSELPSPERGTPREEGKDLFLRNARQAILDHNTQKGIPEGVDAGDWQRLMTLEGIEFGGQLRVMLHRYPAMRSVVPPPSWQRELNPKALALHHALRLPPEQHMQWMLLEPAERKRMEWQWRRDRVLEHIGRSPEYSAEDTQKVRELSEADFEGWLRDQGLTRRPRDGRRGPPRGHLWQHGPEGGPPERPPGGPPEGHTGPPPPNGSLPPRSPHRQKPKGAQAGDRV